MTLPPILAALRKHKASVVLIVLQIALTLAIVSNAIFIISGRIERVNRPTGLTESNLLLVTQQFVGTPNVVSPASIAKLDNLQLADLATLRQIPGVVAVTPTNSLPILQSAWNTAVSTKPHISFKHRSGFDMVGVFTVDADGLAALGLKLVAGRNFRPSEINHTAARSPMQPPVLIITRQLANKLYPDGHALGKVAYIGGRSTPSTIIGIVARMQTAGLNDNADTFAYNSILVPKRLDSAFSSYAVRTRPGQLGAVRSAIRPALYKADPMRVMDDDSVRSFAQIRAEAYKGDIGMAILMAVISAILIAVTAGGIVGLTSFWVGQRHKQIGVRRALGARKRDILHYFQIENLIIVGLGAALGIVLAYALNLVLMQHLALQQMPIFIVAASVVLVFALGQGAVWVPARRAANVSPASATRSV